MSPRLELLCVAGFCAVSIVLWRRYTASYLKDNGFESETWIATPDFRVISEFCFAIRISIGNPVRPPLGVYAHGVSLFLFLFFLLRFGWVALDEVLAAGF